MAIWTLSRMTKTNSNTLEYLLHKSYSYYNMVIYRSLSKTNVPNTTHTRLLSSYNEVGGGVDKGDTI